MTLQQLTDVRISDLMIDAEIVAHVQINNPLEHALLVLVKSGYSAVPVLDANFKLIGTISKSAILNETLGLERFEVERLTNLEVKDVMKTDIPRLKKEDQFIDGLKAVINSPFVCIADDEGQFDGILTRRNILKQLKRDYYTN